MSEILLLFNQDMSSDDIAIRVNTIYRLKIVIALLNNDQIQTQLLPILDSIIKKEEDEVLFSLAKELGLIFNLLPNFQTQVFGLLEQLSSIEETVVRDQAVASINLISNKMT